MFYCSVKKRGQNSHTWAPLKGGLRMLLHLLYLSLWGKIKDPYFKYTNKAFAKEYRYTHPWVHSMYPCQPYINIEGSYGTERCSRYPRYNLERLSFLFLQAKRNTFSSKGGRNCFSTVECLLWLKQFRKIKWTAGERKRSFSPLEFCSLHIFSFYRQLNALLPPRFPEHCHWSRWG